MNGIMKQVSYSTDSSVIVGAGKYVVLSTSSGCSITSDTIEVVGDVPPSLI